MPQRNTLLSYLRKYSKWQQDILVCYRQDLKSSWSDRTTFCSEDFDYFKPYNHRSILNNEIVIEFDEDDRDLNKIHAERVYQRLNRDNIKASVWYSGNKSTHVHFFVDTKNVRNITLLKKVVMRHYSEGLGIPDLRLATENHLIRAEFGIHEKTQHYKKLLYKDKKFPILCKLNSVIWDKYVAKQQASVSQRLSRDLNDLEALPGFKYVFNSEEFRASDDGRERALFMLIHVLKPKYKDNKDELAKFLCEWYRYSGGRKLDDYSIKRKVNYHWTREYTIGEKYLNELLYSIGRSDLIEDGTRQAD